MTPRSPRRRGLFLALFAMAALAANQADSQTLTGIVEEFEHTEYAGISSHFSVTDARVDGVSLYDGNVVIFCSDLAARSIDEDGISYPYVFTQENSPLSIGSMDDFHVWSRYSTPQNEAIAQAQAHWLVDNFYESYFVSTPSGETSARQYAFQNVIWEIMGDGGTAAGLDFTTGNINRSKFAPGGSADAPELWAHMNTLVDAINASGVTGDYVSRYQIFAALDSRDGYQDYFALASTPEAMLVPEPSTGALVLLASGLMVSRRRRS